MPMIENRTTLYRIKYFFIASPKQFYVLSLVNIKKKGIIVIIATESQKELRYVSNESFQGIA